MASLYDSDRRVEERIARHEARSPSRAGPTQLDHPTMLDHPSAEDGAEFDNLEQGDGGSASSWSASPLRALPRVSDERRPFGRRQLLVVAVLVAAGLLIAGWGVLRARPVALASPISEPTMQAKHTAPSAQTARTAGTSAASSVPPLPTAGVAGGHASPSAGPASAAAGGAVSASKAAQIEVHVLGSVRHPGVVRLDDGARVADALRAVGGLTGSAAPGRLNLAQPLGDGQQLYLARKGHGVSEIRDPTSATGAASPASPGSSGAPPGVGSPVPGAAGGTAAGTPGAKLDLNQAGETDLDQLPGIGPVTAGKIIAWRTEHGRFSKVDELQEVDGIGPKTYADLVGRVTV